MPSLEGRALRALASLLEDSDEPLPPELAEALTAELEYRVEQARAASSCVRLRAVS